MQRLRSLLDFLIVAGVGILVVGAANWYPQLPDRIVIHLNGSGEPDGWAPRSVLLWSLFPAIGIGLTVGIQALVRWLEGPAARNPVGINIPDREAFMALAEDARRIALVPVALFMRYTAVLVLGLFIYSVEGMGRLSTGASTSWSSIPVFVFVGAILAAIPFMASRTRRRIQSFQEQLRADQRESTSA